MQDKDILGILEGRELAVKDLAVALESKPGLLYRRLARLVRDGLVKKFGKFVEGRSVAFYTVPSSREIESGCRWQQVKEMLKTGRLYQNNALEVDFEPFLREDIQNLKARHETLDLLLVGLKGIGKSITGIVVGCELDPRFSIGGNVIFRKEQLLRLAVDQPSDRAFLLDDLGTSLNSRNWQEGEREAIFNFFEICRQNRVHLLGTSPSLDLVDLNFRRLIRYVFDCQLRCSDHVHIVIHKSVNPGLKPIFKPVGVLKVFYPRSLQNMITEYEKVKSQQLKGSAVDILERLIRAKEGVRAFVGSHSPSRITEDFVRLALRSCGVDGGLSKQDRDALRTEMFDAFEQKKKADKKIEVQKVETEKESRKRAKLVTAYRSQFQKFIDQGRSENFSHRLSYRLVYEKSKAINLKNLLSVFSQLIKRIKPIFIEDFVLGRIDDVFLVRDLKVIREAFQPFEAFDKLFNTKLWVMFTEDPEIAGQFMVMAVGLKKSFVFTFHKKFSPKKWQESVVARLKLLEVQERQRHVRDLQYERLSAAILDVGGFLFAKQNFGLLSEVRAKKESPFWADIKI